MRDLNPKDIDTLVAVQVPCSCKPYMENPYCSCKLTRPTAASPIWRIPTAAVS